MSAPERSARVITDPNALPAPIGTPYPPHLNAPCAERVRRALGNAAGITGTTVLTQDLGAPFDGQHEVTATTSWGTPSLSMPAVVAAACNAGGSGFVDLSHCTRCSTAGHEPVWFSHRRGDRGRHVVAARLVGAS